MLLHGSICIIKDEKNDVCFVKHVIPFLSYICSYCLYIIEMYIQTVITKKIL